MPLPAFLPLTSPRWLPALALSVAPFWPVAMVAALTTPTAAHATTTSSSTVSAFMLSDVRPEALSWLWDNLDETLFKRAHADNLSLQWLQAPATPQ